MSGEAGSNSITLEKDKIYTMVGTFSDNVFTTLEGKQYDCYTYRKIHKEINVNELCAVNMKWMAKGIDSWVIFQCVMLDKEVVP